MNITDILCQCMGIYFIIWYLQCRQRYKYFRFRRPYCYGCSCHIENGTVPYRVHVI